LHLLEKLKTVLIFQYYGCVKWHFKLY